MADVAVTAGSRRDIVAGNIRMVKADLTSVDNTDTWLPGFRIIEHFEFTPTLAAATTQWGATYSGGTVTFAVESGTLAGSAVVWGY